MRVKVKTINGEKTIVECEGFVGEMPAAEEIEESGLCAYCKRVTDCEIWVETYYGGHANFFVARNFRK